MLLYCVRGQTRLHKCQHMCRNIMKIQPAVYIMCVLPFGCVSSMSVIVTLCIEVPPPIINCYMAMLSSPMKCYCTVSEVKPGSTNVNICVETSWKLFNQHDDAIIIVHECNCYPVYWSPASNHLDALISTFVYRQLRLDKFNFLIGDNCRLVESSLSNIEKYNHFCGHVVNKNFQNSIKY
jgi:hypothetical protein